MAKVPFDPNKHGPSTDPVPSFLTQPRNPEPALPPIPSNVPSNAPEVAAKAAEGFEAIKLLVHERDGLRMENDDLRRRLHDSEVELLLLKKDQSKLAAERDHYMRHSTELVSQLATIQDTINGVVQRARDVAYRNTDPTKGRGRENGLKALAHEFNLEPLNGNQQNGDH